MVVTKYRGYQNGVARTSATLARVRRAKHRCLFPLVEHPTPLLPMFGRKVYAVVVVTERNNNIICIIIILCMCLSNVG